MEKADPEKTLLILVIHKPCFPRLRHIFISIFLGASHWRHHALEDLRKYISLVPNTNVARNVILFIGDGMGTSTVTAARILKGQLAQKRGEETKLFFESLPYVGLSKVRQPL